MKGFSPFDGNHDQRPKGAEGDNQKNPSNIQKIGDITITIGGKEYSDQGLKDEFQAIRRAGKNVPTKKDGSPNYPEVDRIGGKLLTPD